MHEPCPDPLFLGKISFSESQSQVSWSSAIGNAMFFGRLMMSYFPITG